MSATDKLLDVQNVTVEFHIGGLVGGSLLVAVNDVSFSLGMDQPEIFTLAGESGCGPPSTFSNSPLVRRIGIGFCPNVLHFFGMNHNCGMNYMRLAPRGGGG